MKKIIITFIYILVCIQLSAQVRWNNPYNRSGAVSEKKQIKLEEQKIKELFKKDQGEEFKSTEVPDQYKDESAVILAQKVQYSFIKTNVHTFKETVRRRIKLQDKEAVQAFSTIYFHRPEIISSRDKKDVDIGMALIVEKPDGTQRLFSAKDAIKVESTATIPTIYNSGMSVSWTYYKLAVPDLEPGDIIDYVTDNKQVAYKYTDFPSIVYTINEEYSVVYQKIIFNVSKGFALSFNSYNNAPKLKSILAKDRKSYNYELTDTLRDKVKDVRWLNTYKAIPKVKFKVWTPERGFSKKETFVGLKDKPKMTVTKNDIVKSVNRRGMPTFYSRRYAKRLVKAPRSEREKDKAKQLKRAYYHLRNEELVQRNGEGMSEGRFLIEMSSVLKRLKIPYSVIVTSSNQFGTIDEVLFPGELIYILKTDQGYIANFDDFLQFGEIPYYVYGNKAIEFTPKRNFKKTAPKYINLPTFDCSKNTYTSDQTITIDPGFENLVKKERVTVKGGFKDAYLGVRDLTSYKKEDYKNYTNIDPNAKEGHRNIIMKARDERNEEIQKEDEQKEKLKAMEEDTKEDYPVVVSYDSFELNSSGSAEPIKTKNAVKKKPASKAKGKKKGKADVDTEKISDQDIVYTQTYKVGDAVQKAGNVYFVDVIGLIGNQISIDAKEMKRDYDVYMDYPRTMFYNITLTIPEGYAPAYLKDLKVNVMNTAGLFEVIPTFQNQKLVLKIKKQYNANYYTKEDWPKVAEFLNSCYDFSQKKIMLVKTN